MRTKIAYIRVSNSGEERGAAGECLSPVKGPTKTWGGAAPLAKPSMPFAGGSRQVVFGEINWKHTLRNKKK